MSADRNAAIWPVMGILMGLFVLSALSPRTWERVTRIDNGPAPRDVMEYSQEPGVSRDLQWEKGSNVVPQLAAIPPLVQTPDPDSIPAELPIPLDAVSEPTVNPAHPALLADRDQPEVTTPENLAPVEDEFAIDGGPSLEGDFSAHTTNGDAEAASPASNPELTAEDLAAAVWCEPLGLAGYLRAISSAPTTNAWVEEVEGQLQQLRTAMGLHGDEALAVVDRLAELCRDAGRLAKGLGEQSLASELRRAQYALDRRTRIWRRVILVGGLDVVGGRRSEPDPRRLQSCLEEVEALVNCLASAEQWRDYLALHDLAAMGRGRLEMPPSLLAAEVLRRLTRVPATPEQQRVFRSEPLIRLVDQLRLWAAEPVEMRRLMENVERYEEKGLAADARAIAADCIRLMSSPVAEERRLGEMLDAYYRNANLRVTLTADLLNRLVPKREPSVQQVNDRVLGRPVYGRAVTTTDVAFRLVPDAYRLRAALEIHGLVASETSSYAGPATFFNSSWSDFAARKPIELGVHGLSFWPTEVDVQNETRLRSVRTDFDVIPLVGALVQEIARSKAEESKPQAMREMEWKLANRVKDEIDAEADVRLDKASEQLKHRVFGPLADLGLGPAVVSAETTESRMTTRLCLAAPGQLGAHTPRPRALDNSLASVQIHESAMANMVEQFELSGQTLTLAELRSRIATRFDQPQMLQNKNDHDDVAIRFAPDNAVQVRCQQGQLVITVLVAHLYEPRTGEEWENFQVRAYYRPHIHGRRAEFAREGVIHLSGDGLSMRSQIALRGIFSKTFSKQRPLVLTPENMLADPRLSGLGVSHIVMEDGWVSVALGPESTEGNPMVARLPRTDEP